MKGRVKWPAAVAALLAFCVFVGSSAADSPPTVTTDPPGPVGATTAHVSGTVNPQGGPSTTNWRFETTTKLESFFTIWTPGVGGELSGTEAEGTAPVPVEGTIEGLLPDTHYFLRLVAENEFGVNRAETPQPYPSFTTPAIVPQITGVTATPAATEATVGAEVDPGGNTVYYVEYGPTSSYGRRTAPQPLPPGTSPVGVTIGVLGLGPASEYHFRVVAENSAGQAASADQRFTTAAEPPPRASCVNEASRVGAAAGLPDCRAYEQVSPLNKNANDAGATGGIPHYAYATADGEGILYVVRGPQGEVHRGVQGLSISRRTPTGWTSASAIPSGDLEKIVFNRYEPRSPLASTDLNRIVWASNGSYGPPNPDTGTSSALYMGDTRDQSFQWVSQPKIANPVMPPGQIPVSAMIQPAGGSPDLSTLYFTGRPDLLPGEAERMTPPQGSAASEEEPWGLFEYRDGQLHSAGVLPDGTLDPHGATPANMASTASRGTVSNTTLPETMANQVSADGSTLFFLSPDPVVARHFNEPTQLYVRRGGASTLVSRSNLTGEAAPAGVVPAVQRTVPVEGSAGQYVFASADGGVAYFQSTDQLTSDAPGDASVKTYAYKVGSGTLSYLPGVNGTIAAASDDGGRFIFGGAEGIAVWDHGAIVAVTTTAVGSRFSPVTATASGGVFAFATDTPIPGFDNGGRIQIYRYELNGRGLECLSCPSGGAAPTGDAGMSPLQDPDNSLISISGEVREGRAMSEDGRRVFFDTPEPLVRQDTNGKRDVYEWSQEGGVQLISSGRSASNSYFLDSDADGRNVFFSTAEGLNPEDTDGAYDVYDARVDGGFASDASAATCQGEGCLEAAAAAPDLAAAASNALRGAGNAKPGVGIRPRVKKRGIVGAALRLEVVVPGAGRVTVSAPGLKKTTKAYPKAGTYRLSVPLAPRARRSSRAGHRLTLHVHLRFRPKTGRSSTVQFTVSAKA